MLKESAGASLARILGAAGILCAGLAFVACNAILGNEDGYRLVPHEAGPACLLNSECPGGQICIFAVCSPPCLGDVDCEVGARCLRTDSGTACVSSSAAECSGATCPAPTKCSRGACRNTCATSDDCLSGQSCVTRSTVTVGSVCVGTDPTRDPDAPQPDGGGTGGAPSSGGAGGQTATGGKASGGGAGPIGDAGDDAAADGGPCVATGPELCFNGRDDDCNGKLDCEDPACNDLGKCVPDSPGDALGTFFNGMGPCPAGYSALAIKRGIAAEYGCSGCSCVPNDTRCESGVYGHGSHPCPSYEYDGLLHNVFSDRCGSMPADTSVHYFDVRGFTTCTPQGTGTPYPASSIEGATFCTANQVGGGCGSGSRCIPKVTTPVCAMSEGEGSCGSSYSTSTGEAWYTTLDDTRACLDCSCSFGGANCAGAYIAGYTGAACTGNPVQIGNGAQGDNCTLPFAPASGKVIGTPTNPSCPPNTTMTGEVVPRDPRAVCCLPSSPTMP